MGGVSPGLIKGTTAALEQANKNAQNKIGGKMLNKQDQQIAATNGITEAISAKGDIEGV